LPQRKGARQRNKPPVNQQSKKHSKAGWLVNHRTDLQNLRKSLTSLRQELTKQLLLKDKKEKKKTGKSPQPSGKKTMTELLLKYQHQGWMLKA
jgi:hypothetical protein